MTRACPYRWHSLPLLTALPPPHCSPPPNPPTHSPIPPTSRLQKDAPDATAARTRVASECASLLEFCALIALSDDGAPSSGPSPFSGVLMTSLEDDEPAAAGAAAGAAPPATGPCVEAAHWEWAVQQMGLSEEQVRNVPGGRGVGCGQR